MEKQYVIELVIDAKPSLKDPEGATIAADLMRKNGFEMIDDVRTAKLLRIKLKAKNEKEAEKIVERMCREVRLVNPVAHNYIVRILK